MRLCLNLAFLLRAAILSTVVPICSADGLPNVRILPLGDSITKGNGASDNNGYRKRLHDKLTSDGTAADMIGTLHTGTMADNDHEGHSGEFLGDIARYWQAPLKAYPNVVLVHAGTNNMDLERDLDKAPALMQSIIDGILKTSAETVVLVAPIIWANDPRMQANTDKFNAALAGIISQRQNAGKHVMSVPISITKQDLWDKKHPNDRGYEKMASAWYQAILESDKRGWLKSPQKVDANSVPGVGLGIGGGGGSDPGGPSGCSGGNWKSVGPIFDDFRVWASPVDAFSAPSGTKRGNIILADIDGDGHTDVMIAEDDGTVTGYLKVKDTNQWTNIGHINPPWKKVTGDMIRMADVNNDGRADMIVLYSDGAAKVWQNTKNGRAFETMDAKWATGVESREKIRFADMDGDGYADYVILYDGGAVKWLRNTHNNGKDDKKSNWESAKTIAPGVGGEEAKSAHLYDLDGDGKADYVLIRKDGSVRALKNTGNLNKDLNQRNWEDLGEIAPGIAGVTGDMIVFSDFNGDGRADFVAIDAGGSMRMWQNLGIIGKSADNIRFADLNGDGKDDVIYVNSNGMARAWLNQGLGRWKNVGVIAPGLKEDLSSARIEFADVNGDKLADFIVIYGGGAVKAYLNNGNIEIKPGGERVWSEPITIAPGVGQPGRKVRIEDLDGDGYADYLVLYDGGAVDFYRNRHNIPQKDGGRIWEDKKTVATGAGEPGDKIRFADITGDGLPEYVIQYEGGASKAMWNTGKIKGNDKARYWNSMGVIAAGVREQGPVRYGDLNGDGKADYLVVYDTGRISAWINTCDWKPPKDGPPPDDGGDGGDGGDDGKKCSAEDRPYWHGDIKDGKYFPEASKSSGAWPSFPNADKTTYVVLINGSPDDFKFDEARGNKYTMDAWDFVDVPAGVAMQMKQKYKDNSTNSIPDDKGEAFYEIGGDYDTGFQIQARTHTDHTDEGPDSPYGIFDLREKWLFDRMDNVVGFSKGESEETGTNTHRSYNYILTGSEKLGRYYNSLRPPTDYLHQIMDVIGERKLKHVAMLGSHDSGMYKINGKTAFANKANTQTQAHNFYDQLKFGARFFDIRPVLGKGGEVLTGHYSKVGPTWQGANGGSIDDIVDDINKFTADNAELIILHLSHTLDTDNGYGELTKDQMKQVIDKLKKLNYLCGGLKTPVQERTMNELIGEGKACIVIIDNTKSDSKQEDGFYGTTSFGWDNEGEYSDTENGQSMAEDQVNKLQDKKEVTKDGHDNFYVMQWILTVKGGDTVVANSTLSIEGFATYMAYDTVFWKGWNGMSPTSYPNVVLMDYIGERQFGQAIVKTYEPLALVMAINLAIASKNCYVGGGTIYDD